MATLKYLTGKVTKSDGTPVAGATVSFKINQPALVTGTQEIVDSVIHATTAGDGTYTLQAYSNSDLTPGGTYYKYQSRGGDGGSQALSPIIVPTGVDSGGHDGSVGNPYVMSLLVGAIPALTPGPGHVASLVVDGAATFSAGPVTIGGTLGVTGLASFAGGITVTAGPVTLPAASIADAALSANVALLTGAQAFTGVKTFTANPVFNAGAIPEAAIASLVADLAARALDSAVVHNTGNEAVAGVKTFSASPIVVSATSWQVNAAGDGAFRSLTAGPPNGPYVRPPTNANGEILGSLTPLKLRTPLPFAAIGLSGSPVINVLGHDANAGRLYALDRSFGGLAMSADYFATAWQNGKSLPPNCLYSNCGNIVRFGSNVYILGKDTTSGLWGIYKSPIPPLVTNDFVWGAQMVPLTTGTTGPFPLTQFCGTSTSLLVGEYGDPVGGPHIWRSIDGVAWSSVWTDAGVRHVHAILEDPYNLGTVYATLGDGGTTKSMIRSTDGGATWATFVTGSPGNTWQAVQISFSPTWIYLASDRPGRSFALCDRSGNIFNGSSNFHKNIAVPFAAASTDAFYSGSYYGAYDPTNDIYYLLANDTSSPGNTVGLFYQASPGGPIELIAKATGNENGQIWVAGPNVWFGDGFVPLYSKVVA